MKILRYTLLLLVVLLTSVQLVSAQQVQLEEKEDESRRGMWYLIPEVELWFGTYSIVEITPQIAYHLTDRWSLGTGLNYNFYKEITSSYTDGFSTHLFGGRVFSRYAVITHAEEWLPVYLFSDLYLHLEYQMMNMESKYFYAPTFPENGRFWSEQVYVGLGFTQNIGQFSSYSFTLLWDINRDIYSPYGNPVYRIGLNIYF